MYGTHGVGCELTQPVHRKHTNRPEVDPINGGIRSHDMFHENNVSVSNTTENNTDFIQPLWLAVRDS